MDTSWSLSIVLAVALIVGSISSHSVERHGDNPFNDNFLTEVLARAKTWKPDVSFRGGIHFATFRNVPGIYESPMSFHLHTKNYHQQVADAVYLPENFDSRDKWPHCKSLQSIRNQGTCGSCWAVATVSVMSDRLCIHSNGSINLELATEDLMGCCKDCGHGCDGGFMDGTAFQYWVDAGLVSGAPYNSSEGCKPYPFKPCLYPFINCHQEKSPKCQHHCVEGSERRYHKDKFYGSAAYKLPNDERAIRLEIMTNGPVATGFSVYEDMYFYRSGVYQHVHGEKVGMHAVRVIGWGVERGVKYWLIANSYGEQWGEGGYLKMLRGSNHLGIESTVIAGLPDV